MREDLSTQFPNPPELQPITSASAKIWRSVSLFLTFGGLALMGVGGWIFMQQQIEASKPPPARILEVSVPDLEPTETTLSDTSLEPASPIEDELPVIPREVSGDTLVSEPAKPSTSNATLEEGVELQKEVVPESEPEVTHSDEAVSLAEAKLLEETTLTQEETALTSDSTATESPLSLADNPLPVVESEDDSASVDTEPDATQSDESIPTTGGTGKPLTRIVAESIGLDAEVTEVGWETVMQDGAASNVWVVADFAAGWHKNSKLPGQGGNIVMSAHHNIKGRVFRYTVDLEPGDIVTLYDEVQSYDYVVEDKFILKDKGEPEAVRQENAKWIGPFDEERLTLVTCWPYNSNTHRLIVIAKLVDEKQAVTQ